MKRFAPDLSSLQVRWVSHRAAAIGWSGMLGKGYGSHTNGRVQGLGEQLLSVTEEDRSFRVVFRSHKGRG